MSVDRKDYYKLALFVSGNITLKTLAEVLNKLCDEEIYPELSSFDFQKDGLFFECETDTEIIESKINRIDDGRGLLELDWDTMSEWDLGDDEE